LRLNFRRGKKRKGCVREKNILAFDHEGEKGGREKKFFGASALKGGELMGKRGGGVAHPNWGRGKKERGAAFIYEKKK